MSTAFPLSWPDGWLRAKQRRQSAYKVTTEVALSELHSELRLMGAKHVVVSSNVPLRRDGTMYRGDHAETAIADPGVAVYWDARDGRALVAAFDAWRTVRENVRAIGLTVAGLRAIERAGAIQLLERAYSGFARLPETAGGARSWWDVLGVARDATPAFIRSVYHRLAAEHHPDKGGNAAVMAEINDAYRLALVERAP